MDLNLFGFLFGKKQNEPLQSTVEDQKTTPSFVPPDDYDGSVVVDAGGFLSTVFDFGAQYRDENALIQNSGVLGSVKIIKNLTGFVIGTTEYIALLVIDSFAKTILQLLFQQIV